jgi:hypothetical protein
MNALEDVKTAIWLQKMEPYKVQKYDMNMNKSTPSLKTSRVQLFLYLL